MRPRSLASLLVLLTMACGPIDVGSDAGPSGDDAGVVDDAGVPGPRSFTVLYTSDEHGALLPDLGMGGAANVLARWNAHEEVSEDTHLILSGGDMWMGPAISTWLDGAPTIEAMNQMGYAAASVGNHEFDLGQEVLEARQAQANFPFLGANILDGEPPSNDERFADYELFDVAGVSVAVVGLTNIDNPTLVLPSLIEGLAFPGYRATVEEVVPLARLEGAEVVIVAAHDGYGAMVEALPALDVDVDLWLLGHSHGVVVDTLLGAPAVVPGARWQAYARTRIAIDDDGEVTVELPEIVPVLADGSAPDADLQTYLDGVVADLDDTLGEVIGYLDAPVYQALVDQGNWVTDAYLWAFPEADIALQNRGGLRTTLLPGELTRGDILDVFTFPNSVVLLNLTSAQLTAELERDAADCAITDPLCFPAIAGFVIDADADGLALLWPDGSPIADDEELRLVTNNFLYEGGGGFTLAEHDADAYYTGAHYSQPAMDWTRAQRTTEDAPLYDLIDGSPRVGADSLEPIGYATEAMDALDWRVTNMVADAFLAAAPTADVAWLTSADLAHDLPEGIVTRGDAYALFPWADELVTIEVSLETLRSLIGDITALCPMAEVGSLGPGRCRVIVGGMRWTLNGSVVELETLDGDPLVTDGGVVEVVSTEFYTTVGFGNVVIPGEATAIDLSAYAAIANHLDALGSDEQAPLDVLLDGEPRGP
jgi:5'-nucleotidase/UDP-sugar diphosphatase